MCHGPCHYIPWWTFRIFFIFSARGRGRGSPGRQGGGGVGFFVEKSQEGGGVSQEGGGGPRGPRVSAGNLRGGG